MGLFDQFQGQQAATQTQPQMRPAPSSDPFSRIETSEGRQGGVYPLPGVYPVLFVDILKMIRSRKNEDVFVAEFDILHSEVGDRPAGTRMSWPVNFRHDASPGNVKAFLAAVMNVPQEQVDGRGAQYACSEKNPCHGRLVRLEATMTTTKSGNPFTLCTWRAVPDDLQSRAMELREKVGFPPF